MITCALVTEADGSSTPAPTQTGRSVVRLMNDNHEINISRRCSYMFVMIDSLASSASMLFPLMQLSVAFWSK
jgi:hypothetical protein